MIEAQLLSKVLNQQNFHVLNSHGIQEGDFQGLAPVYGFIKDYAKEYGTTPDYRTVIGKFDDFEYFEDVHDTFPYLCKTLKSATIKRRSVEIFGKKANDNYKTMNGIEFASWLKKEAEALEGMALATSSLGTNYATNGQERKEWYMESKEQRTFTYIPTPWESLTRWLGGGFELSDMILIQAYTNRGKSWLSSACAVTAHKAGFGVLYYSPELSKKQQAFRFDTLDGHYDNVNVRRGNLEDKEEEYFEYLDTFNETNETPFIIKTMEDLPEGLSTDVIEADLNAYENIKMVVVDGFNLMNHGGGNLRDSMSKTSRKLRQVFGRHVVAGVVVHQTPTSAEKENMDEDDLGIRMVTPPRIDQYGETVAVIQDSATVLNFDQHDGVGKALLAKCREPNVGKVLELRCNFNYGWITESTPLDDM
ncbi:TPA: AAA family ATPase [Bacillus cereus]|nr:AAA family ATPase [Bacillus cereus]